MSVIRLSHPTGEINGNIFLDGSKSISNRVLIIRALCRATFKIHHLSTSDDTSLLSNLLNKKNASVYNVGHAGTTFRFFTAYLALQQGIQVLTGSSRMLERPIGPLVDALNCIGCDIIYEGKKGYPPLRIGPVDKNLLKSEVTIDSGISSQYITALILIAPVLPRGLVIRLSGDMVSESYLQLTLGIVRDFGINAVYEKNCIRIPPQEYIVQDYTIEADWSASSYHYALVALSASGQIKLKGLFENSLQGDAAMVDIGRKIGIKSKWAENQWVLEKTAAPKTFKYNFINQPDIAQTLSVICASTKIRNEFTGLKTLRIKETDRIDALNRELGKVGSSFILKGMSENGEEIYSASNGITFDNGTPRFETYKDHRMAMSLAPLALLHPIEIIDPEVVTKSYPAFWEDLKSLGFIIEEGRS